MLTFRQMRDIARYINSIGVWPRELFDVISAMSPAEQETLGHVVGLEYKLAKRKQRSACDGIECGKPDTIDGCASYGAAWSRSLWADHGESVNTHWYVIGEDKARDMYLALAPEHNQSAYSPTGRWFRSSPSLRHMRGNVWRVQSCSHIDC